MYLCSVYKAKSSVTLRLICVAISEKVAHVYIRSVNGHHGLSKIREKASCYIEDLAALAVRF